MNKMFSLANIMKKLYLIPILLLVIILTTNLTGCANVQKNNSEEWNQKFEEYKNEIIDISNSNWSNVYNMYEELLAYNASWAKEYMLRFIILKYEFECEKMYNGDTPISVSISKTVDESTDEYVRIIFNKSKRGLYSKTVNYYKDQDSFPDNVSKTIGEGALDDFIDITSFITEKVPNSISSNGIIHMDDTEISFNFPQIRIGRWDQYGTILINWKFLSEEEYASYYEQYNK